MIVLHMINIDISASTKGNSRTFKPKDRGSYRKSEVKKNPKGIAPKIILLAFLFSTIFLFLENKHLFIHSVENLFRFGKSAVIYDTYSISFNDDVPEEFVNSMKSNLSKLVFEGKPRFEFDKKNADIVVGMQQGDGSKEVFSKDFIPVGHFYSLLTNISLDQLKSKKVFMLDSETEKFLEKKLGIEITVVGEGKDALVEKLKESDENIALFSFEDLDPRVKIIPLDNKYYLDDKEGSVKFSFYSSVEPKDEFILSVIARNMGNASFDEDFLSKVNMGGVVAIARNLAFKMEEVKDYAYPAKEIGDFLADADLTHVSNEVSFVPGCMPTRSMAFCSNPNYIESLKKSGVDIVELTGNHNNDYGAKYSASTIETFKELGWDYFGGGLNEEDAKKILYKEVNGTKLAFIGYNYYDSIHNNIGPLARDGISGANSYSESKLKEDIAEAKKNADVVITTFQFQECYAYPDGDVIYPICYQPLSVPDQRGTFKKAIDLGADIVVGTQAHQPQTYELYGDGVIFYGLGNLFFDQYIWIGTRQGLVLTHYFYDGKYIQTKVVPIYMDKDFVVRLATEEQGALLLKLLKQARD
ncbi:MAG TPA: CapA family protein [Candidatus Dojkabacteria bacterium]|nr:CapA family protein [Candidatus Dojkabacteria bacterium]